MDICIYILLWTEKIIFILFALCVLYLLLYAIASKFYIPALYPDTPIKNRFAILFPAYKADDSIIKSVSSFFQQDYPADKYDVIVIADHMREDTCEQLRKIGANVLQATYENSTKAKALTLAMQSIEAQQYDMIVILDADNTTVPSFLEEVNKAHAAGIQALQAHRVAKNLNTEIALLDAASEEINNGIFRSGHVAMGLSCALIGSGMAINAQWFAKNVNKLETAGEDKELEALLQKARIHVAYLSQVPVYDEKTQKKEVIKQQRKRWIATQIESLRANLPELPGAILSKNFSYADKIIQWMLPPRLIQLAGVIGFTFIITIVAALSTFPGIALKWWILLIAQIIAMFLPLPKYLANKQMLKALFHIPMLAVSMVNNILHIKGANKTFIHTEH